MGQRAIDLAERQLESDDGKEAGRSFDFWCEGVNYRATLRLKIERLPA